MNAVEKEKRVALKLRLKDRITEKEKTMNVKDVNIELTDGDLCELAKGIEGVQEKELLRIDKVVTTRLLAIPDGPEV